MTGLARGQGSHIATPPPETPGRDARQPASSFVLLAVVRPDRHAGSGGVGRTRLWRPAPHAGEPGVVRAAPRSVGRTHAPRLANPHTGAPTEFLADPQA